MSTSEKEIFSLTGIIIETESKRYTAFFEEFPEVLAEGDTEEEVKMNLLNAVKTVLEYKKKQYNTSQLQYGQPKGKTKQFTPKFELIA